MGKLSGKVAIVTGGRGIGAGIVSVLAGEGAKVMVATRTLKYGEETAAAIRKAGSDATAIACDIGKRDDVIAMADATIKTYGTVDLLVNNAAIFPRDFIENVTVEDVDTCIDVNIKGCFWLIQACLPYLKKAKDGGRIILLSSGGGVRYGTPTYSVYNTTKAAVNGLSMTMANELARFKITSNVVEPGVTMSATLAEKYSAEDQKAAEAAIPLGRISQPEDIGHACLFFCLPENSIVTGQVLAVDGGLSTGGAQASAIE